MIKVNNLSVAYRSIKKNIFENISFNILKGEKIAIVGKSGIGKTTLINIIGNNYIKEEIEIKSGEIIINNNSGIKIRTVFQNNTLLPWFNVFDNILLGLGESKINKESKKKYYNEIMNGLKKVEMEGNENYYPSELSLGMKQRVNFLRAILSKPDILLLDEPFSSVDRQTKEILETTLLDLYKNKQMTSILVTHNLDEAKKLTSKIFHISKNTVVYEN